MRKSHAATQSKEDMESSKIEAQISKEELLAKAIENQDVKLLTELAESNHAKAQYYLADYYMRGLGGLEADPAIGMQWCEKGANNGYPECIINMGRMAGANGDFTTARKWFDKALDLEIPSAYSQIGGMYLYGEGETQDFRKAFEYLMRGHNLGDTQSSYMLGIMYEQRVNGLSDDNQALKYFLIAADAGIPQAQFNVGLFYIMGRGCEIDYVEAMKWTKKSSQCRLVQCTAESKMVGRQIGRLIFSKIVLKYIVMTTELYVEIRQYLRELIRGTEWEGHLYAVGGCCRDELMGHPIKDVDMAVNLPAGGIRFAEWLHENGYTLHQPVTYPNYGTAMLRLREFPDDEIELVQTRKEKYTDRNRRNPETAFGTLEDDCMRRDLTINSLYYDISNERFVDITGRGINDIHDEIIRTPVDPDVTYDDDPLRILRCIRFASRYGWDIESETFAGMCRNADRLSIITPERIKDELDKMLTCAHPVMALELMRECGVMQHVIPELCRTFDMRQNHYHFGTVWEHTLKVEENVPAYLPLRMAALLHDVGKIVTRTVSGDGGIHFLQHEVASADMARKILQRLKYSNAFIDEIIFLVKHHMDFKQYGDNAKKLKDKKLRKFQYLCSTKERFDKMMTLIDADNKAHADGYCMPNQVETIRQRTVKMEADGSVMFSYRLPLTGNDIMRIKGLKPGPAVKECNDYLMKLAFNNPLRPVEEFEKHLKGYHLT